jgi:hypothetical protein
MESKTEEFLTSTYTVESRGDRPANFRLYEEYSGCSLQATISSRREQYGKTDVDSRRRLEAAVDEEIEGFRVWLVRVKNFEDDTAIHCAISMKSLLLGLPVGLQVAHLFDIIMSR